MILTPADFIALFVVIVAAEIIATVGSQLIITRFLMGEMEIEKIDEEDLD